MRPSENRVARFQTASFHFSMTNPRRVYRLKATHALPDIRQRPSENTNRLSDTPHPCVRTASFPVLPNCAKISATACVAAQHNLPERQRPSENLFYGFQTASCAVRPIPLAGTWLPLCRRAEIFPAKRVRFTLHKKQADKN
ncbi:hypothetical protein [Kingella potus]|uniref:hypothetical protein n=1 Tax=Kingella potus TaxID=265175 RepID=UPI001FD127AC|nr:hypothetical protein [Kingella potus]UOP00256.1 hypothetical protein LVJ84_10055 [Kingella potus]